MEFPRTTRVLARYSESYECRCVDCGSSYTLGVRKCPNCGSRHQRVAEAAPKIKSKHPGILEIPEGKEFVDMSVDHFIGLAKKKGAGKIQTALSNLIRWMGPGSKNPNPEVVKKAKAARDAIKKQVTEKK